MEFLLTVGYIALCLVLFSLAIAIHEFGHFIVALKLGLKVERFSIGFGPAIWKKTWKGVEYRISCIPLGGYVSIPDVDPEGTKALEGAKDSVAKEKIPAWKELLVAVAGPMMNVVLAVVLAVILSLMPSAKFGQQTTEIGGFSRESVARDAGLQKGDIVVSVAGHPVSTWLELQTEIQITDGNPTEFTVRRPKQLTETVTLKLTPTAGEEAASASGLVAETNAYAMVVDGFWGDRVAEKAGLQIGDRILSVNGERIASDLDLAMAVQTADAARPVSLQVARGTDDPVTVSLSPVEAKRLIGKTWLTGWVIQATCVTNAFPAQLAQVRPGSAAEAAGFKADDLILSVNGTATGTFGDVEAALAAAAGSQIDLVVERAIPSAERVYDDVTLTVTPKRSETSGAYLIEAISLPVPNGAVSWMPARNPLAQLGSDAGAIFRILKALVTPKEASGTGKALGGPVLIAEGIYRSVRRDFSDGLGFLRFLNTNLAVMNLLPIPVLDGGLIVFALIALIFRRRVPDKIVGVLSTVFMYLLLAVMAFLIYRDSIRSWKIHHAEDPAEKVECVIPEGINAV